MVVPFIFILFRLSKTARSAFRPAPRPRIRVASMVPDRGHEEYLVDLEGTYLKLLICVGDSEELAPKICMWIG